MTKPPDRPRVLIVGSGIAGLSAALELVKDCHVTVVERRSRPGGKCRTWMADGSVPAEHGWRFFNRTYANLLDTLERIPSPLGGSCRDRLRRKQQRPLAYLRAAVSQHREHVSGNPFRILRDAWRLLSLLLLSDERIGSDFPEHDFADWMTGAREERLPADEGPPSLVYRICQEFLGTVWSAEKHAYDLDVTRNMLDNFMVNRMRLLTLDGPTSEVLIEPWVEHLESLGVEFQFARELAAIDYDVESRTIERVALAEPRTTADRQWQQVDSLLCAIPEDRLLPLLPKEMVSDFPGLAELGEVERVWQNGVQIYTDEVQDLHLNIFMGHPWKLTVVSHAENWREDYEFAKFGVGKNRSGVADVLSFVISEWHTPGPLSGKAAKYCSALEIYEELCAACEADPRVVRNFDRGHHLELSTKASMTNTETTCDPLFWAIDEALVFSSDGSEVVRNGRSSGFLSCRGLSSTDSL